MGQKYGRPPKDKHLASFGQPNHLSIKIFQQILLFTAHDDLRSQLSAMVRCLLDKSIGTNGLIMENGSLLKWGSAFLGFGKVEGQYLFRFFWREGIDLKNLFSWGLHIELGCEFKVPESILLFITFFILLFDVSFSYYVSLLFIWVDTFCCIFFNSGGIYWLGGLWVEFYFAGSTEDNYFFIDRKMADSLYIVEMIFLTFL